MNIVGKGFDIPGFQAHVDSLHFNGWTPNFVVVHNTSSPDLKLYLQWLKRQNWTGEQWMKNLASYYAGMGWKAGPHLFVAPDRIWTLTPLTQRGTHSPAWNSFTWGVETVGEFEREAFDGGTQANLTAALAILHTRIGLNPADYKRGVRGLHYHKEDPKTTHKSCPGKNIKKAELIKGVVDYMNQLAPGGHAHVSEAVHTAVTTLDDVANTSPQWLQEKLNHWFAIPKPNWQTLKISTTRLDAGTKKELKVLQSNGWTPLTVDGSIGSKTKAAVAVYQAVNGLKLIDGIAGPLTRMALQEGDK
jgi:N-acetylmuramoyl-L-alanine amidase-like protein/putative peptidoglycan binding protein